MNNFDCCVVFYELDCVAWIKVMDYLLNLKQIWTPELQVVEMSKAIPELTDNILAFDGQQKQP